VQSVQVLLGGLDRRKPAGCAGRRRPDAEVRSEVVVAEHIERPVELHEVHSAGDRRSEIDDACGELLTLEAIEHALLSSGREELRGRFAIPAVHFDTQLRPKHLHADVVVQREDPERSILGQVVFQTAEPRQDILEEPRLREMMSKEKPPHDVLNGTGQLQQLRSFAMPPQRLGLKPTDDLFVVQIRPLDYRRELIEQRERVTMVRLRGGVLLSQRLKGEQGPQFARQFRNERQPELVAEPGTDEPCGLHCSCITHTNWRATEGSCDAAFGACQASICRWFMRFLNHNDPSQQGAAAASTMLASLGQPVAQGHCSAPGFVRFTGSGLCAPTR
jgi:hypothetical protein